MSKNLRRIASIYLWGFVIYQILPIKVIPYTNYAPKELYPVPVIYRYNFAYDVKTSFSNHAGSIKNLLSAMKRKDFDIAFGDFPEGIKEKLFPTPEEKGCRVMRNTDISLLSSAVHLLFEVIPKLAVGKEVSDLLSFKQIKSPSKCYLVAHDDRILFTAFFGLDFPPYDYILGNRRNIYFSRELLIRDLYSEDFIKGSVVAFGNPKFKVFAYSERSFYLPGEETRYPFRYVVETNLKNPLVVLYKDKTVLGYYNQRRLNLSFNRRGSYSVHILTYKFKIYIFYFGIRTVALVSPIKLL